MRGLILSASAVVLYGLCILPAKVIALLLGRDTLRLRRRRGQGTYWVTKSSTGETQGYFSPGHVPGERSSNPALRLVLPLYYGIGRLAAPKRGPSSAATPTSAAERQQGIPDEIYTLW